MSICFFKFGISIVLLAFSVSSVSSVTFTETLLRNSRLVYDVQSKESEYRLVKSSLKKINGVWASGNERIVVGQLNRKTYELDSLLNFRQAKSELLKSLGDQTQAFSCLGLDCGSSNAWANEIFNIKQLYGLDNYQFYSVVEKADQVWVIYLVQRGNRRVYLQVDNLNLASSGQEDSVSYDKILDALRGAGFWVFKSSTPFDGIEEGKIESLVSGLNGLLAQSGESELWIVGHSSEPSAQSVSLQYAEQVLAHLVRSGLSQSRANAIGIGAMAPRKNVVADRVEFVLIMKKGG